MHNTLRWIFNYVTCIECGKMFREISAAHCRSHGMTRAEYRDKYGIPEGVKLNHHNLKGLWMPDLKPDYKGIAKIFIPNYSNVHSKNPSHIKFFLDYVTGLECWIGKIFVARSIGLSSRRFYVDYRYGNNQYALSLKNKERQYVRMVGFDHFDHSYLFESAWPMLIHDNELFRNTWKSDNRLEGDFSNWKLPIS